MTCTNAASTGNKGLESKFVSLYVDVAAVTETWQQPGEENGELMAGERSFFMITLMCIFHDIREPCGRQDQIYTKWVEMLGLELLYFPILVVGSVTTFLHWVE